jgi:hypothetical protein
LVRNTLSLHTETGSRDIADLFRNLPHRKMNE